MADVKYSETLPTVATSLIGTELVSLSYDSANTPGAEVWVDRVITITELKTWINT